MKNIVAMILIIPICLTGCSNKDFSESDNQTGNPSTLVSPTPEITSLSVNEEGKIVLLNKTERPTFNRDMIKWLNNTTKIPIYLPEAWKPMKKYGNKQHYYIEASGDSNSYSFNVYTTKVSVNFNDNEDLLNKNGPICEADFVGAVSGAKTDVSDIAFEIPKDSTSFDLTPQITAYEEEEGCSVWWTQKGWNFSYVGSNNKQILKTFATAWSDSDILVSKAGNVKIVGGNRFTFYYTWEKDGCQYGFTTQETNFEKVINILNSFIIIDEKLKE